VLRKLAGDSKVAFEMRGGKKKWYSVEAMQQQTATRLFSEVKTSLVANIKVMEIPYCDI
jgi:hypothetical protein